MNKAAFQQNVISKSRSCTSWAWTGALDSTLQMGACRNSSRTLRKQPAFQQLSHKGSPPVVHSPHWFIRFHGSFPDTPEPDSEMWLQEQHMLWAGFFVSFWKNAGKSVVDSFHCFKGRMAVKEPISKAPWEPRASDHGESPTSWWASRAWHITGDS